MSLENPYDQACCINKYYHLYLSKFLYRAFRSTSIPYEDYYQTPKSEKVDALYKIFRRCYVNVQKRNNSVMKASWSYSKRLLGAACILLFIESCLSAVSAFLLGGILNKISLLNERSSKDDVMQVGIFTVGLILNTFLYMFIHPMSYFLMYQCSYRLRIVLNVLIYEKVLRLKSYMLNQTSSGEILNMVSIDLGKFDFVGMFLTFFLVAPFYFVVKAGCSYFIIGKAGVLGCSLFLILIPIQLSFTRLFARYRVASAMVADERVKLMREVIDGIRVIKMYVWEESFASVIRRLRSAEVTELVKMHVLNGINYGINAGAPQFVVMVTILVNLYVQGSHLVPDTFFAYISLMVDVRYYAQMFTLALPYLSEVRIAFDRIQKLIDISEDPQFYVDSVKEKDNLEAAQKNQQPQKEESEGGCDKKDNDSDNEDDLSFLKREAAEDDDVAKKEQHVGEDFVKEDKPAYIKLSNVTAVHDTSISDTNTGFRLSKLSFTAKPGDLIIVVGASGCGKSSVLNCILDEMVIVSGKKQMRGKIAYASQEAWILGGTLRENILFGSYHETPVYNEVVLACSLTRDFEIMADGDLTVVGERGSGLSGGQKARIGLARAAYRHADIILLDDPLSAVDNHVSKELFENCINGYLKKKVVVLATHQTQYLPYATKVVLLHEGEMLSCGSLEQLMSRGYDIPNMVMSEEEKRASVVQPDQVKLEAIMEVARLNEDQIGTDVPREDYFSYASEAPNSEFDDTSSRYSSKLKKDEDNISCSFVSNGPLWATNFDLSAAVAAAVRAGGAGVGGRGVTGGDATRRVASQRSQHSQKKLSTKQKMQISNLTALNSCASLPVFFSEFGFQEESEASSTHLQGTTKSSKPEVRSLEQEAPAPAAGGAEVTVLQPSKQQPGAETEAVGSIKVELYVHLFKMSGPVLGTLLVIFLGISAIACQITADRFLTSWTKNNLRRDTFEHLVSENGVPIRVGGEPVKAIGPEVHDWEYMRIYITLVSAFVLLNVLASATFCVMLAHASQRIHDFMFTRMLRVVTKFFDDHPSGQILNKFSKDVGIVDIDLNRSFFDFSRLAYMFVGYYIAISIVNVWVLALSIPLLIVIVVVRTIYLPGSRAIKRKEAVARSPVYTHISVTLSNICSIHAYGNEEQMRRQIIRYVDVHTGFWFLFITSSRWFGTVIDIVMAIFQSCTILMGVGFAFYGINGFGPSGLGFMLYYTFALLVIAQYMLRQSCEVDLLMTSVERIRDYYDLPIEGDRKDVIVPDPSWPKTGKIQFKNASLKYDAGDGTSKYALRNLNITINHGEKIGVCGRTGAGKSSLIVLLTRLFEVSEGEIWIDDVDCGKVSLSRLRRSISIIPQDPVLFSRSVRDNLDPFHDYQDEIIRDALSRVEILEPLEKLPHGLDTMVAEGGSNFSVGQRQLLCLARALISETKVLLVDEATANVDFATDQLIQRTLREVFADATVLTIAHRLNTILDSTRVIVLDAGQIVEFGTPKELKAMPNGFFHNLLQNREDL